MIKKDFDKIRKNLFNVTISWVQKQYESYKRDYKKKLGNDLILLRNLAYIKKHIRIFLDHFQNDDPLREVDISNFIIPRPRLEKLFLQRRNELAKKRYSAEEVKFLFEDLSLICYKFIDRIQEDIQDLTKKVKAGKIYFQDYNILMAIKKGQIYVEQTETIPEKAIVIDKANVLVPAEKKINPHMDDIDDFQRRDEAAKAEIAKHYASPADIELKKTKMDERRVQHNYLK